MEINRLLKRVNELLHQPRDASRGRLMSLAFVLAPIAPRKLRLGGDIMQRKRSRAR